MSYSQPSEKEQEKNPNTLPRLKTTTPHQFLKLSRKITSIVSSKRPVEIQLGIGCGKHLLFPAIGTVKIEALLNQQNRLIGSKPMESPPTTPTHAYSISTISFDDAPHSFPNRPVLLDRLVADVLSHLDSYPDPSVCSEDLLYLKPRLEAYHHKAC